MRKWLLGVDDEVSQWQKDEPLTLAPWIAKGHIVEKIIETQLTVFNGNSVITKGSPELVGDHTLKLKANMIASIGLDSLTMSKGQEKWLLLTWD